MKKTIIYLSVILLTILICSDLAAQKYSRVKVTLKDGTYLEGKKGILTPEQISFLMGEAHKSYNLQEVNIIMGKKNRIGAYALGFGGGCFVICMIAVIANPNDADQGTLIAGSLIWTGIFTGIGAGIGAIASKWKTVYAGSQHTTSVLHRMNLTVRSYQEAPYNIGVSYRF